MFSCFLDLYPPDASRIPQWDNQKYLHVLFSVPRGQSVAWLRTTGIWREVVLWVVWLRKTSGRLCERSSGWSKVVARPSRGSSSQRSQCSVLYTNSRGRCVWGRWRGREWRGALERVVSCREDFAFCPKCREVSLEDFEQRSAMIRLVLKGSPWLPRGG